MSAREQHRLEQLLAEYAGRLICYLQRMVASHAAAEAIACETLAEACRAGACHETALFGAATRRALDWLRAARQTSGPDLASEQLAAVLLHKCERMACAEIAAVLGCSTAAAAGMLMRAYTGPAPR